MKTCNRFAVPRMTPEKRVLLRRRAGDIAADVMIALCVGIALIIGYFGP